MSEYNLLEANKMLINSGAYLARDMDFSPERKPMGIMAQRKLESRVERWRESAMKIVQQHQSAHKEIQSLKSRIEALENPSWKQFIAGAEKWLTKYPPDIFDGSSGDPGPLFIVAFRKALADLPKGAE